MVLPPRLVVIGILAVFAAAQAALALVQTRAPFDVAVTQAWQRFDPEPLEPLMHALNDDWNVLRLLAALLVLGYGLATKRTFVLFLLAPVAAQSLNPLLKELFDRPRPTADLVDVTEQAAGTGYPSGHVMSAVLFFGFLFVLAADLIPNRPLRWMVRAGCLAVIVLIGPARVYSGAHWPSDVIGGYAFGVLILLALVQAYHWYMARRAGTNVESEVD